VWERRPALRRVSSRVLTNHRRALLWSVALLIACVVALWAVGRHPPQAAPETTLAVVGRVDLAVSHGVDDIRVAPLTWTFRFLNVVGGGLVTIPLRAAVSLILLVRRRWRALAAFVLTWISSEVLLAWMKAVFHRGRPPHPLVSTIGYSFPSGHAVAATALAVALVLAFLPPGPSRRRWEWLAVAFAFTMAFSRVYLLAHWFSDVAAGVLLGSGVALACAGLATEVRDVAARRATHPRTEAEALAQRRGSTP
jgi:membrane-associated phospholipid phosphatase